MKLSYLFFSSLSTLLLIASCKNDDNLIDLCASVTCLPGQTCQNGNCTGNAIPTESPSILVNKTGQLTTNESWSADSIYILNSKVVIPSGITLTIEAGTIIKGAEGQESNASALIVAKGAMIMAEGTATKPIIFTSTLDNIEVGQNTGTNLTENDRGLWGGLIILGDAPSSVSGSDKTGLIEGIPANETFASFGGDNAEDNSGVLKYISVRHGGIALATDEEINGITFGGVGSGTTVDHIEVVANNDDGIEWFGGTVNVTNALVYGQSDDALDIDMNYAGSITNAVILQGDYSDAALEIDGPEGSSYVDGKFTITNLTVMSEGTGGAKNRLGTLKSSAQGTIDNAVFVKTNFDKDLRIRVSYQNECTEVKNDAYSHIVAETPTLEIKNSEFISDTTLASLLSLYTESADCEVIDENENTLDAIINESNNTVQSEVSTNKGANQSVFGWTWSKANNKI